jgi:hypothetical protein
MLVLGGLLHARLPSQVSSSVLTIGALCAGFGIVVLIGMTDVTSALLVAIAFVLAALLAVPAVARLRTSIMLLAAAFALGGFYDLLKLHPMWLLTLVAIAFVLAIASLASRRRSVIE